MGEEAAFDKRVVGINVCQALVEAVIVVGRNPRVGVKQEGAVATFTRTIAALRD